MTDIYPKFYYCANGVSDKLWIFDRLKYVPESKKIEVCYEYERLYLSVRNGRRIANTYLNQVAKEFRQAEYEQKKKMQRM